jgi:hypothetical protein
MSSVKQGLPNEEHISGYSPPPILSIGDGAPKLKGDKDVSPPRLFGLLIKIARLRRNGLGPLGQSGEVYHKTAKVFYLIDQ